MVNKSPGPILIELAEEPEISPANADPVPDTNPINHAGPPVTDFYSTRNSGGNILGKLLFWLIFLLLGTLFSLWISDLIHSALSRDDIFGTIILSLVFGISVILVLLTVKELSAISRLRKIETIQTNAKKARGQNDLTHAQDVTEKLCNMLFARPELRWKIERFKANSAEIVDADTHFLLAEQELLNDLDQIAIKSVETGARQVASVTALVPVALVDVLSTLFINIKMIREIAETYGMRPGFAGGWQLVRRLSIHLIATGAIELTDDLLGTIASGSLVSKISRRFGEGLVNGAFTARIGIAAIQMCRPLPFNDNDVQKTSSIMKSALFGMFKKN